MSLCASSLHLFTHPSVHPFIHPFPCVLPSTPLSIPPSTHPLPSPPSIHTRIPPFTYTPIHPCIHPFITPPSLLPLSFHPSLHPSLHPLIPPSIFPSTSTPPHAFPPPNIPICPVPPAAQLIASRQWCGMEPCEEGEQCALLRNRSGWSCMRRLGRIKTITVSPSLSPVSPLPPFVRETEAGLGARPTGAGKGSGCWSPKRGAFRGGEYVSMREGWFIRGPEGLLGWGRGFGAPPRTHRLYALGPPPTSAQPQLPPSLQHHSAPMKYSPNIFPTGVLTAAST